MPKRTGATAAPASAPAIQASASITVAGQPSPAPSTGGTTGPLPTPALVPAALTGKVKAPATLLSNNGAGIISDNGSGIIGNNGGAILGNNGGSYRLQAVATQVPVAGAAVRLLDAAGNPVTGADGKPLTATTNASGDYSFASVPAGHNLVLSTNLGATGSLTAIAPKGGTKADVDLISTLTTTYILDQYVKSQSDPLKTLDKLPANVEADTREKAGAALTAVPDALTPTKVVAAVDSLRKADKTFDDQMEAVKKLLIVAGQSDLGNGLPADQVDLSGVERLLWKHAGGLVIVTANRIWTIAPDGTLVKLLDSPNDPITDAALDDQDRLLVLYGYAPINNRTRWVAKRQEPDGSLTDLGTVQEDTQGRWAPCLGILPGAAGEALVYTEVALLPPAKGTLTQWSLAAGRAPTSKALPYGEAMGGKVARRADGTLLFGNGSVMNTSYALAPGATSLKALNASMYMPIPVTPDGMAVQIDPNTHTLSRLDPDGTFHQLLSDPGPLTGGFGTMVIASSPDGALYIGFAEFGATASVNQVFKVVDGKATVLAGRKPATQGNATTLPLHNPTGLALGPNGAMLINDDGNILQVSADGTTAPWSGGKVPVASGNLGTNRIRTDAAGNIYLGVEDDFKPPGSNPRADRLIRITPTGETTTIATLPDRWDEIGAVAVGPAGPLAVVAVHLDYVSVKDNLLFGPGVWTGLTATPRFSATEPASPDLGFPFPVVAVDPAGQAYVANKTQTFKIGADGALTPYLAAGFVKGGAFAVDAKGRAYFANTTTAGAAGTTSVLDRYAPGGVHDVVAGPGGRWFAGSGVDDSLGEVADMAFAPDGALLLLDAGHKQVKRIPPDGL